MLQSVIVVDCMPSVIQGQEIKEEAGGAAVCRQRSAAVDFGRAPPDLLSSTSQQASYVADSQGFNAFAIATQVTKLVVQTQAIGRSNRVSVDPGLTCSFIAASCREIDPSARWRNSRLWESKSPFRIPTWLCGARWFFFFGVRYVLRTLLMVRDRRLQIQLERRVCVMG